MRLTRWLGQLRQQRGRSRRQGALARRATRCRLAEVELLEDRTQLTPMTYAATDLPLQVPPGDPDSAGTTVSTIHVADDFVVQDVNVQLNIEHTFDADLQVVLIAPDGTRVELFSGIGNAGDNFTDTILDQQAEHSITDSDAPFTGTYQSAEDLSIFNGQHSLGAWQLEITDNAAGDSGTLLSWSVTLDDTHTEVSAFEIHRTDDKGLYSIRVGATGELTVTASNNDGLPFENRVLLLTSDLRLLREATPEVTDNGQRQFSVIVGSGEYRLQIIPTEEDLSLANLHLETTFNLASNPIQPLHVGGLTERAVADDVNNDGFLDVIAAVSSSDQVRVLLGRGNGTFEVGASLSVGSYPVFVVLGHFNADPWGDLATSNYESNDVSLLLGNADGTFESAEPLPVGTSPYSIGIGDFNHDQQTDLVVANAGSNDVSLLLAKKEGLFEPAKNFSVGLSPVSLAVGRFNADEWLDIVTANYDSDDISILLGREDGSFEPARQVSAGLNLRSPNQPTNPAAVITDDFNGDGMQDIACANSFSDVVAIFMGNGDGTFQAAKQYQLGLNVSPFDIASADFNGDGQRDIVTANHRADDLSVLLGRGDGTFEAKRDFSVGDYPSSVATGDFNRDGRIDVIAANFHSRDVSLLLGNGDGTLGTSNHFRSGDEFASNSVVAGDFNGDGRIDLVSPNAFNGVSIRAGRGDGTLEEAVAFPAGKDVEAVATGDFNRDGRLDLVTANSHSNSVLLGRGNGEFELPQSIPTDVEPTAVVTGDFNDDHILDFATANFISNNVSIFLGVGNGTFKPAQQFPVGSRDKEIAAGDLNHDGHLDLVTANPRSSNVSVLLGIGDGTFQPYESYAVGDRTRFPMGTSPFGVVIADFDEDGNLDLATPDFDSNEISVLFGRGDGTFQDSIDFPVGSHPFSLAVDDFDGDGHQDLISANRDSDDLSVLFGGGDGTFTPAQQVFAGIFPRRLVNQDFNGDGREDLAIFSTYVVTVLLGNQEHLFTRPLGISPLVNHARSVVADVNADHQADSFILAQDGMLLYRAASVNKGEFETPIVINPDTPARELARLRSPEGPLIATLDTSGRSVSLYQTGVTHQVTRVGRVPLTESLPVHIAAGNLDNDAVGRDDFVLIDVSTQSVSVYLASNNGFELTDTLLTGAGPTQVIVQDLDGDGVAEIVIANQASGDVSVFQNDGHGHFSTSIFAAGERPVFIGPTESNLTRPEVQSLEQTASVAVGDFNGDDRKDIIVANPGSNSFAVLFRLFDGSYSTPAVTLLSGRNTRFATVEVADLDRDGDDDVVFANQAGTRITPVLQEVLSDGQHVLTQRAVQDLPTALTGLTLHDANGDGLPDVFATNEFGDLLLLLNQGDGRFAEDRQAQRSIPIAVQDLDGDGKLDVVLANQGLDAVKINYGRSDDPKALQELASSDNGVTAPGAVKLADLNGDGVADLIVPNTGGNSVLIYKGRGDGTFEAGESIFTGSNPTSVTVNDLDHDGHMDLVVTNRGSNTVAVFYGQAVSDSQTIAGTTAIPFRAGALSRLPSGSGPVDAQVVSLPNPDGSMQTGLVVTNSTSNSVSFIPSVGNGIFNAIPSNTVPLGFSPLPGAIVNGNLVLPNPGGNSLGFVPLSAAIFNGSQPNISFSLPVFDRPVGIDGTADVNQDGLFDLLVANNGDGSVSLLLGDGKGFDFSGSFFLDGITHASALQVAGFELYVTEEGHEFFTVFDLADLRFEKGDHILDFEEIAGSVASTVASTNRPIYGLGLFSPLVFALFGQFPLDEDANQAEADVRDELGSWRTLTLIVTQITQQIDRLREDFGNSFLVSMLETLSTDLGLAKLNHQQLSQTKFETLVTPLSLLSGTQPLTQLVRTLRSLWSTRQSTPTNRPAGSTTPPANKPPLKGPMKAKPAQSTAIPMNGKASESATLSHADLESSTLGAFRTDASGETKLATYMTQIASNPAIASELFDDQRLPQAEFSLPAIETSCNTESDAGWQVFAASVVIGPAVAELSSRRLRKTALRLTS